MREDRKRITAPALSRMKEQGRKIVMVTAYDYPSAQMADRAEVDVTLVGDSVGMTELGYSDVLPVTLEDILHHTRAVRRGLKWALLIADLPFGSYQISLEEAARSAVRLLKEGGAQAVKLEGGAHAAPLVRKLTESGIPVMAHIGLTPQSVNLFGGYFPQGLSSASADTLRKDALLLQEAGAFGIVLETIPAELAEQITNSLIIPTIGIGSGPHCDGQVQVWHDLLGITTGRPYRHVKRYANLAVNIESALREYADEVRSNRFPTKDHSI